MARKKLSLIDHAWLRMDHPENLMIITGLMAFDAPPDIELLKEKIETHMLRFRRFKQRVVVPRLPFMRPSWEDDPGFTIENHLERVVLPEPADQAALEDLISLLMSEELDPRRPLWRFYIVEKYGEGSALIGRLHHSIADGISLMQVLLSLTDVNPEGDSPDEAGGEDKPTMVPVKTSNASALANTQVQLHDLWDEGRKLLGDREHARIRARQGLKFAAAVGKLALRWPDPQSRFKGPLSFDKRAAWSQPVSLAEVKETGKYFQATVNDVLLSAVAGALGRYLAEYGDSVARGTLRGVIPVNLRPLELDEDLGNKFGLVFLTLPVGKHDPVERLYKLKANMDGLKSSVEPAATFVILGVLGAIPGRLEALATAFFDTKGSAVMTNVPGPQTQLYLAGAPINTLMAWVPQSGRISLGVSIISYNGSVWLGVATDAGLVPDPEFHRRVFPGGV